MLSRSRSTPASRDMAAARTGRTAGSTPGPAGGSRSRADGSGKTCGSLLAALDVHPRVAMQILRHSKIAVTMEIYTEVPSAATRDALRKLGQWLDS